MSRPVPALSLLAALVVLAPSPSAAADLLQARGEAGVLVLKQSAAGAQVRRGDLGDRVGDGADAVVLPPGASLHSLQATTAGWTAAGTAPAGDGSRLLILSRDAAGTRELPPPSTSGLVREPVLLASRGALRGLAWIEGNEVRAAERAGQGWTPPRTVAAFASGTTMSLAGSVLTEATWVVLWSAFDGEDDEIYWTARAGDGEWARPSRLAADNLVPDLTPAVRSVPGGALAAWSRFDGTEYELVLSNFDGTSWTAPRRVAGAGLRPSFPDLPGTPVVLYRTARPRGWALLEARGDFAEIARSSDQRADRPVVEAQGGAGRVLWDDPPEPRSE